MDKGLSLNDEEKSNTELKIFDGNKRENKLTTEELNEKNIKEELRKEQNLFQWDKLKFILMSYMTMVGLSLIKGSDFFKSVVGIEK